MKDGILATLHEKVDFDMLKGVVHEKYEFSEENNQLAVFWLDQMFDYDFSEPCIDVLRRNPKGRKRCQPTRHVVPWATLLDQRHSQHGPGLPWTNCAFGETLHGRIPRTFHNQNELRKSFSLLSKRYLKVFPVNKMPSKGFLRFNHHLSFHPFARFFLFLLFYNKMIKSLLSFLIFIMNHY